MLNDMEKFEEILKDNGVPFVDEQRRSDVLSAMKAAYNMAIVDASENVLSKQMCMDDTCDGCKNGCNSPYTAIDRQSILNLLIP